MGVGRFDTHNSFKTIWMDAVIKKQEIKVKFLSKAMEHGEAISLGDYKKANKIHKELQTIYDQAKTYNVSTLFSELLDETDENVCLWASTFTLKIYPDLAEESLNRLAESPSVTGLSAQTTLLLWREGRLNLL